MKTRIIALTVLAVAVTAIFFTAFAQGTRFNITLNQNYSGAPGNMVVQTDAYGNLTGDRNAPLILPSPTRPGFDFRGWFTTSAATGGTRVLSGANGTRFTANTAIYARWTTKTVRTLDDIPLLEREHFNWVRTVRNDCEPVIRTQSAHSIGNLIFHQVFAGNGSFNWAIRWESDDTVSLQQRRNIAAMLYDGINEWLRPLMGYADWPFGEIPVVVVGWAVQDANLIRDRQPNETIWVNSTHEAPNSGYNTGFMTSASRARSRFINYNTINNTQGGHINYRWPDSIGGLSGRFDQYLWLTKNKEGGNGSAEGGDWGFRWGQQSPATGSGTQAGNAHAANGTINGVMLHEIGHAFGFYDWYGSATGNCATRGIPRNPPALNGQPAYGNSSRTIMHFTYNTNVSSSVSGIGGLNQYDQWQVRYYWSWIREVSPANRWQFTPVAWVPETATDVTTIAAARPQTPSFRFDNRGTLRYNLGGASFAELKVFDSRGRVVKSMRLCGTQTLANTNLNVAPQMLMWRVESEGRVMDQGRMQFTAR